MDLLLCPKGDVLRAAGEELLDLLVPLGSWGLERFCVHDWASWWHCLPSERKYLLMLAIQLSIPHWHRGEGEGVQDLGAHVWLYLFLQFTRVLVWHRIGLLWTLGVGLNYHTPVKNLAGVRSFLPRWDPEARVREKPSVRFISISAGHLIAVRTLLLIRTAKSHTQPRLIREYWLEWSLDVEFYFSAQYENLHRSQNL